MMKFKSLKGHMNKAKNFKYIKKIIFRLIGIQVCKIRMILIFKILQSKIKQIIKVFLIISNKN